MSAMTARLGRLIEANPMIHKELRGRMRGVRAFGILTIYLSLLSLFALFFYWVLNPESNRVMYYLNQQTGRNLLQAIVVFESLLVMFLAPAFTAGVISGERERQTFDLLMTTLLRPRAIVAGKMGAALAYLLLLILAALPLESLAFMIGGVAPEEIICVQIVLLCAALLYGSIGLFWSSLMRSTVAATVLTYGTLIFLLGGLPFLWVVSLMVLSMNNNGSNNLSHEVLYIYFSGMILSSNPVVAMGISQELVRSGKPLFFYIDSTSISGTSYPVLQPWVFFCLLAVVLSGLLLAWSIRVLPPVRRRPPPPPVGAYGGPPPAPVYAEGGGEEAARIAGEPAGRPDAPPDPAGAVDRPPEAAQ